MKELKLITPIGLLGYSYARDNFERALEGGADLIGVDAGSTDPGPYYLGSGTSFTHRGAVKDDLRWMLLAGRRLNAPVVVGSCGSAGGEPHLQWVREIAEEIAGEENLHFRMALVHAEQPKDYLKRKLSEGKVQALRPAGPLEEDTIGRSCRIVGVMGVEPYIEAFRHGAEVVLAGRSDDAAVFASYPVYRGYPPELAWTAGKLLECGGACAVPRHKFGHTGLLVTLTDDSLLAEPLHPMQQCTPESLASFFLHENENPNVHIEPSGVLDLSGCRFEALSQRVGRISGMRWRPSERYTVKLEAVELAGYRCITIGGTRDPILIRCIDDYLEMVRSQTVERAQAMGIDTATFKMVFRVYGKNAVMGRWEPRRDTQAHELGIIVEVVAETQELANELLALARIRFKNGFFEGKLCDEGTIAFPYAPSDIAVGPVYRFTMWHVVEPADPLEMFPIEYVEL
ncbi:MAG: acyclic terpene utilization AtuA family protein [Chloroflexi bacterium]|nr:acyclic terpene utilization AtuA family protein [Chloroflexota bacterium]